LSIQAELDLSEVNLDGSRTLAKKVGERVVYQGRKKAKTCHQLPLTDYHRHLPVVARQPQ
ncbi:MAG: IS5/IS1182 family transposase, partial [Trueperaceae bacterium]